MALTLWTMPLTEKAIIMAQGAFDTAGATTVNADSNAGQTNLNVAATSGFHPGAAIIINSGGARQETAVVGTVNSSTQMTLEGNLAFTHTAAQADAVAVQDKTLATALRQNLLDLNLDTYASWASAPSGNIYGIWLDTGSAASDWDGFAILFRNYASLSASNWTIGLYTSTDGSAITIKTGFVAPVQLTRQLNVYTLSSAVTNIRYAFIRIISADAVIPQIAGVFLLKKYTLARHDDLPSQTGEIARNVRAVTATGRQLVRAAHGRITPQFEKKFKNLAESDLSTLRNVFSDCKGSRWPFIWDNSDDAGDAIELLRFDQDAIKWETRDYQLHDVTLQFSALPYIASGETL